MNRCSGHQGETTVEMVKVKSERTESDSRTPGLDTSQLLFTEPEDESTPPRPPESSPATRLRKAVATAEEARSRAERANLVAESTAAAAETSRLAALEAISTAEKAEAEANEAARIARKYQVEAEESKKRAAQLQQKLDAAAAASAAANRVSAWIEYPRPGIKADRPETAGRPAVEPEAAELSVVPEPEPRARKRFVVPKGYEIVKELEDDEVGVLCLARQVSMDRLVQLKLLHGERAADTKLVERFLLEARTAGKFNHPNLMRVHAAGRVGRQYFYSTEHIDGRSLLAAVKEAGKFDPRRGCQVIRTLASGLEQWEKHGLVHGGLNPSRTVQAPSGDFKLLGLGLATRGIDLMAELAPGELCYVAPELVLGDTADSRADVYSLGAVLYFMLTGKVPHEADNRGDVIRAAREEPTVLANSMHGVPRALAMVVMKALQPDPAGRYELIPDLIRALETGISGSKIIAAVAERAKASRRRRRSQ